MEFRTFRNFLVLAEELHFRKAANRLYISQPALSKQIKDLEEDLGFKLFNRDNRNVKLTKAGIFLAQNLHRILQELDSTIHHARLTSQGKQGQLKFGYVGSAMQQVIPQLLLSFRKNHPSVLFDLEEMGNQEQIKMLLSGELDMGFVRVDQVPLDLEMHAVLEEHFCLVLPADHSVNQQNFCSLDQLKDEFFILFNPEYSTSYFNKVTEIFKTSGFIPKISHNTIHSSSIFKLVEHSFGVSIVPKSLQMDHFNGIQFIDLINIPQRTTLYATWKKENDNPVMHELLQILRNEKFHYL